MQRCTYSLLLLLLAAIGACDNTPRLQPLASDAVVLAFGDSLTFGTGAARDRSYPAQLQQMLGRKVINAGVPGEISATGLQRLPALLERYQPELVIVCHGGNDILRRRPPQSTRANLQQMIDLAHGRNAQVVLVAVPEFGFFLSAAPFYEELAETNKLPIADEVLSDILADNRLKSDRIHPNAEGYRQLAENIHALLARAGAISPGQ